MSFWKDTFQKIIGKKPEQPTTPASIVAELPKHEMDAIVQGLRGCKTTGAAGISLIKNFEGLVLEAYPDPGTGGAPWTIGYGHTGKDVKPGLVITPDKAEELLRKDLQIFEAGVNSFVTTQITQNQFDALVSFAYNCGLNNLSSSTLLKLVNAGDKAGAADQFLRWNKAAGKVMAGLTKRRTAERALFLL